MERCKRDMDWRNREMETGDWKIGGWEKKREKVIEK